MTTAKIVSKKLWGTQYDSSDWINFQRISGAKFLTKVWSLANAVLSRFLWHRKLKEVLTFQTIKRQLSVEIKIKKWFQVKKDSTLSLQYVWRLIIILNWASFEIVWIQTLSEIFLILLESPFSFRKKCSVKKYNNELAPSLSFAKLNLTFGWHEMSHILYKAKLFSPYRQHDKNLFNEVIQTFYLLKKTFEVNSFNSKSQPTGSLKRLFFEFFYSWFDTMIQNFLWLLKRRNFFQKEVVRGSLSFWCQD